MNEHAFLVNPSKETAIQLVDDWIAALRSGKFEQGRHHLVADGKYCCLGVLCEIAGMEKDLDYNKEQGFVFYEPDEEGRSTERYVDTSELGNNFRGSLGMSGNTESTLVMMNDGYKRSDDIEVSPQSFYAISEYIDEIVRAEVISKWS